ncbi:MAG: glycosyltransferase family 2 protein [Tissierella sp.]|uniref:glycosyltransferase family 2 protein n=1 Tax=Tissierella sp. TaxID=41274 RepID=UPI003F9AE59A
MSDIMVSINCITYNHENYIEDAIKSFLMQKTDFDFEVLIHDDASTDRTADIIRKYEETYPKIIKSIIQKENQHSKKIGKIAHKFNHSRAKGKYIALCEGDDYWTDPYKLQKQVDYMEENPECTLCTHTVKQVKSNKELDAMVRPYNINTICPIEDIIIGGGYFFGTASLLYPKKLMDNPPEFYMNASTGDYPLQILLSHKGYTYYFDEIMAVYRVGVKASWSQRYSTSKNFEIIKINHANKSIDMLKGFNEYSNNLYFNAVNEKILQFEFNKLLIQNKIKEIKLGKYKKLYDNLGTLKKLKVNCRFYFPSIYQNLINVKNSLRGL